MIQIKQKSKNPYGLTEAEVEKIFSQLKELYAIYYSKPDVKKLELNIIIKNIIDNNENFYGQITYQSKFRYCSLIELNFYHIENKNRFKRTLAHELTHYIQHKSDIDILYLDRYQSSLNQPCEIEANIFSWWLFGVCRFRYAEYSHLRKAYHELVDKINKIKKW